MRTTAILSKWKFTFLRTVNTTARLECVVALLLCKPLGLNPTPKGAISYLESRRVAAEAVLGLLRSQALDEATLKENSCQAAVLKCEKSIKNIALHRHSLFCTLGFR